MTVQVVFIVFCIVPCWRLLPLVWKWLDHCETVAELLPRFPLLHLGKQLCISKVTVLLIHKNVFLGSCVACTVGMRISEVQTAVGQPPDFYHSLCWLWILVLIIVYLIWFYDQKNIFFCSVTYCMIYNLSFYGF